MNTTLVVPAFVPSMPVLMLLVASALNLRFRKCWYNVLQLIGLALWGLLPLVRLVVPGLAVSNHSLPSRLFGYGTQLGLTLFAVGYLAMALQKKRR